jgi:hypothetical protein
MLFSDDDLRVIWLEASIECFKQGQFKYAVEAFKNASKEQPPYNWSTGVRIAT